MKKLRYLFTNFPEIKKSEVNYIVNCIKKFLAGIKQLGLF